ncbi:MAG: flippase [Candidatus Magasanikbacteria bacterium]|nr:flippase [Candidatus Magasanikbacteria bacterium]
MRTVAHNTAFLTGASMVQKALSFVYFTLLAVTFSTDQIGAYSYSLAFTAIFAIIVDGGLTQVLIRFVAKNPGEARTLFFRVLKIKLALLLVALGAMTIVVTHVTAAYSTKNIIFLAAAIMIVDSLNLSVYGVLRGHQDLVYESVGLIAAQLTSLCGAVAVAFLHLPITAALLGLGLGSLVNASIGIIGLFRSGLLQSVSQSTLKFATLIREATPFAIAGACARGYSYLDLLLLGSFTNFTIAGIYSIANKLTFVFQFIPLALSAALYPAFSKLIGVDSETLRKLWHGAERYLILMLGAIVMLLISLRFDILGFFNQSHVPAASTTLIILSISLCFSFLSYPVGAVLNAAGLQKLQTTAMAVTLGVNAALNVILIPRLGAVGAAMSALFGNFLLFAIGAWFVQRRAITLPWMDVAKLTGACVICALAGSAAIFGAKYMLASSLSAISAAHVGRFTSKAIIFVTLAALSIVGLVLYAAALCVMNVVKKDDLMQLRNRFKRVV